MLRRVFAFSFAKLSESDDGRRGLHCPTILILIHFDIIFGLKEIKTIWESSEVFIFEIRKSNTFASYEEPIIWIFLRLDPCASQ